MRIFNQDYVLFGRSRQDFSFWGLRLRTKLLTALIPSVVLMLLGTGYITHWFSKQFLNEAIERNVQFQTLAIAHEVEIFLNQCREDLLMMTQEPMTLFDLVRSLQSRIHVRGFTYRELGFISLKGEDHIFIRAVGDTISAVPPGEMALIRPSPYDLLEKAGELKKNEVWISDIMEVVYPPGFNGRDKQKISARVIRLLTPCFEEGTGQTGLLFLSIDLFQLRDILSLFNSPPSPIFAYIRSPGVRYSYLFDKEGWILFQSEGIDDQKKEFSTDLARSGLSGNMGKPGFDSAFKPSAVHVDHRKMVADISAGKHGLIKVSNTEKGPESGSDQYYVGYAPIRFSQTNDGKLMIFQGVAFVDKSKLSLWAGYRQIDVMFVLTLTTIVFISLLIVALSRVITKPTLELVSAVDQIHGSNRLEEIHLPDQDYETSLLKNAINKMIATLRKQIEEIRIKDEKIELERQRERVRLEEEIQNLRKHLHSHDIAEIVGIGPVIDTLKSNVMKAASVDADVLIAGETGTGKQLIAEAIHRHSTRAEKPFISINCGALDEGLLLDSLFGHVKGAYTEAKADRKGAFLAAHGGTLFLDEIGTASPRVQQALLRAVSMRKIKPLGSDQEIRVDVRLIAATNLDLKMLIERGLFREDLYYRLEVLTIRTPPLRDHKENVPALVDYFLKQACRLMNKDGVAMTRGALEKLMGYHWPGNVRELMNCITRAVAMAGGTLIHGDDIRFGGETPSFADKSYSKGESLEHRNRPTRSYEGEIVSAELNERQRRIFSLFMDKSRISRSDYQNAVGNGFPSRTALYDLHDLVEKGLLRKVGKGPATRYYLAKLPDSAK